MEFESKCFVLMGGISKKIRAPVIYRSNDNDITLVQKGGSQQVILGAAWDPLMALKPASVMSQLGRLGSRLSKAAWALERWQPVLPLLAAMVTSTSLRLRRLGRLGRGGRRRVPESRSPAGFKFKLALTPSQALTSLAVYSTPSAAAQARPPRRCTCQVADSERVGLVRLRVTVAGRVPRPRAQLEARDAGRHLSV